MGIHGQNVVIDQAIPPIGKTNSPVHGQRQHLWIFRPLLNPTVAEFVPFQAGTYRFTATSDDDMGISISWIFLPGLGFLSGALIGGIGGDAESFIFPSLESKNIPSNRVEFSSIIEKDSRYLIILWQGKKIRLQRSEYNYRGITKEGNLYIIVPKHIYESKFK